jgi:hypothetical protein
MINQLANLLNLFPGPDNQTRCFVHVLNLIAKSIIRQFDVPKTQALAVDIDLEKKTKRHGLESRSDEDDEDNIDGWIDERESMSAEDVEKLDESVQPVQFMLAKVI